MMKREKKESMRKKRRKMKMKKVRKRRIIERKRERSDEKKDEHDKGMERRERIKMGKNPIVTNLHMFRFFSYSIYTNHYCRVLTTLCAL